MSLRNQVLGSKIRSSFSILRCLQRKESSKKTKQIFLIIRSLSACLCFAAWRRRRWWGHNQLAHVLAGHARGDVPTQRTAAAQRPSSDAVTTATAGPAAAADAGGHRSGAATQGPAGGGVSRTHRGSGERI